VYCLACSGAGYGVQGLAAEELDDLRDPQSDCQWPSPCLVGAAGVGVCVLQKFGHHDYVLKLVCKALYDSCKRLLFLNYLLTYMAWLQPKHPAVK
jgi:hypothetical protein